MKPRITLNKSRGRQSSMGLSQQLSLQSQHSLQQQPSTGGPLLQPVAYRQEQQQAYRQEQQAQQQVQEQQQQQAGQYDYYSGAHPHSYDSNHAEGTYGGMHDASYMSHGYSHKATADPAAAAAGGGMYGTGYPDAGGAVPAHGSTDLAAAAAGGMYGAHTGDMYGMGYDAAAAAATAHVDYSAQAAYWQQPSQAKGQKRSRASTRPAATAPVETSPLGPRSKRPKPGQFRDTEEEDADEVGVGVLG
jgi:hypothetical protein